MVILHVQMGLRDYLFSVAKTMVTADLPAGYEWPRLVNTPENRLLGALQTLGGGWKQTGMFFFSANSPRLTFE